ncbi:MAG: 2-C-methyl-D-erythritol 4-phosphate cytidylyltransferase [Actinobacteria bacterium]|nr:2-C-methyl-D-erythritol 4-phosphate cytidylyltransferase [Actinomycetota bacterium]
MNVAIITAAGKSTRLKGNISKQFMSLYNKPVLAHTLTAFQNSSKIEEIYVTVPLNYLDFCKKNVVEKYRFSKVKKLIPGGETRQASVYNALCELPCDCEIVSIHDGVRPLITTSEVDFLIERLLEENRKDPDVMGVIIASPAYETIKEVDKNGEIKCTIPRENVWHAQTPQTFFYRAILESHKKALEDNFIGTDDASLVERMGWKIKVVRGSHENIKITTPIDLFLAELIIHRKSNRGKYH